MLKATRNITNKNAPKRVALYIRTSTLEQVRDGYGLDMQERLLRALVESNSDQGWTTTESLIYREEGISGATPVSDRPALSRLKLDILEGKIDILCVWRIDRLFRHTGYLLDFIDFLKERKVNFVSKSENIDLNTVTWKLALSIFGAMATAERETIAERTMQWKLSKAMQWFIVYGNLVPYGYRKVHDGKWNRLIVDPEELEVVREIFSMFVEENMGTGEIARILTARNIGTNIDWKLQEWEKISEKKHKGLFRQHNIARMLRNTTYIGEYICNRKASVKIDGKTIQRLKDESEWVRIPCDPIVDRRIFERAQKLLDKSGELYRRWETHIFTGLVKCAECGKSFNYYKAHKGTGQYRCWGKQKDKVSRENLCKNRDISELKLLNIIWPEIERYLKNPWKALKRYKELIQSGNVSAHIEPLQKELAKTEERLALKRVIHKDALRKELEGGENAETYGNIAKDLTIELHDLEKLKYRLTLEIASYNRQEEEIKIVMERAKEYQERLGKLTEERKYEFIRQLVHQIQLSREKGRVILNFERG